uniref:2-methoxy-6-polyprenyl-1,4-benzoquinol methylase, mitochondrial n=1 Tax=Leersia perrieri TaxID=77586 RepID=A0A0D9XR79_9ORYZ
MALRAAAGRLGSSSRRLLPVLLSPSSTNDHKSFLHSHATSFGYKHVPEEEKSKLVGNVFSSVASSYDVMNDLMSVGLHRLWKDRLASNDPHPQYHFITLGLPYCFLPLLRLISKLNPFPGMKHLDVAGGTGDVAFRVLDRINSVSHRAMQGTLTDIEEDTQIYVCDINSNMLNVGKKRASERGYKEGHRLSWIQGDAEALSFEDGSMDGYTIAFGIRNVTHIEKALSEAYRVLKRGGRFLCLELSHVDVPLFKEIYDVYSFSVIPAMGELVAGDRQSYQYLVESIRRFPNQEKFSQMIKDAGFEGIEYENLVGGVVAIHSGVKL